MVESDSMSGFQKFFGFLKSAARAEQKCPRTLSSILSKQKIKNYGRIMVESDSMSGFKKFLVF